MSEIVSRARNKGWTQIRFKDVFSASMKCWLVDVYVDVTTFMYVSISACSVK